MYDRVICYCFNWCLKAYHFSREAYPGLHQLCYNFIIVIFFLSSYHFIFFVWRWVYKIQHTLLLLNQFSCYLLFRLLKKYWVERKNSRMNYSYIDKNKVDICMKQQKSKHHQYIRIIINVYFHFWKHTANELLSTEYCRPRFLMVRHPRRIQLFESHVEWHWQVLGNFWNGIRVDLVFIYIFNLIIQMHNKLWFIVLIYLSYT